MYIKIYDASTGTYRSATCYVFTNGSWQRCLAYVYKENLQEWRMTVG